MCMERLHCIILATEPTVAGAEGIIERGERHTVGMDSITKSGEVNNLLFTVYIFQIFPPTKAKMGIILLNNCRTIGAGDDWQWRWRRGERTIADCLQQLGGDKFLSGFRDRSFQPH